MAHRPAPLRAILFSTPGSRWTVAAIAAVLFLTAPVAFLSYLMTELGASADPGDDAEAVRAWGGFLITWIATIPLTWGFVWLAIRRYPGRVPLMAWNAARPVWSAGWTMFAGASAGAFLALFAIGDGLSQIWFNLHVLLDAWFLLVLRAAVVADGDATRVIAAAAPPAYRSGPRA